MIEHAVMIPSDETFDGRCPVLVLEREGLDWAIRLNGPPKWPVRLRTCNSRTVGAAYIVSALAALGREDWADLERFGEAIAAIARIQQQPTEDTEATCDT